MFLRCPYFIERRSIKFTLSIQRLGDRDDRTTDFRTGHPEPTCLDRGLRLRGSHRCQRIRHRQKDQPSLGLPRLQASLCDRLSDKAGNPVMSSGHQKKGIQPKRGYWNPPTQAKPCHQWSAAEIKSGHRVGSTPIKRQERR